MVLFVIWRSLWRIAYSVKCLRLERKSLDDARALRRAAAPLQHVCIVRHSAP
jgi:hypothetical protein